MANPSWPAVLPQYFDRDGFERSGPNEIDRSTMDAGPAKQRAKARGGAEAIAGTLFCRNDQQRDDFREFVRTTLKNGTLEFDWVDPETQLPCTMRFTAPPRYTRLGTRTLAHCQMEILP